MKSYIEKQALFYILVCSEILSENEEVLLEQLAPLFTCSEKEKRDIRLILGRDEFKNSTSILQITMLQNYLNSFGKGSNHFGSSPMEATALEIRKSAYILLSELKKDLRASVDLRGVVARLAEQNSEMEVLYALLLYCQNADRKLIFSSLKKAAHDDQLDARILLPYFTDSVEQRKIFLAEMAKCSASRIYPEIIDRIAAHYGEVEINENGGKNHDE